jgi:hypothetical protein
MFNCPEDLATELRIGMGVAGDHHDIGVDLTEKGEAAIDLEHPSGIPSSGGSLRSSR